MKLVFATHNKNKFEEVKNMCPPNVELLSLEDIGCTDEIPETADTIEENAILKAEYVRMHYNHDCFADDTGLEVDSLNGAPGVYSARYAGESKDPGANIKKLLNELEEKIERTGRFKTVIALNLRGNEALFTGICEGEILFEPRGNKGFGYDPVFLPKGKKKSFAEMEQNEKAKLSHRGKAFRELMDYLSK